METAEYGNIVQTRWRYDEYLDEPHDIIYKNQSHGYVNAKQRPAVILGMQGNDVLLAPLKTKQHANGNLKYGAQKAMDAGKMYDIPESTNIHMPKHQNGTILDFTELRRVPIREFTFRALQDPNTKTPARLPESMLNDIRDKMDIKALRNTGTFKSVPLTENTRIHKQDLQVRFEKAASAMKNSKSKAKKNAKAVYSQLRDEKRACFASGDWEKEEHREARKYNLTREEMNNMVLSDALDSLNAQDDIQL